MIPNLVMMALQFLESLWKLSYVSRVWLLPGICWLLEMTIKCMSFALMAIGKTSKHVLTQKKKKNWIGWWIKTDIWGNFLFNYSFDFLKGLIRRKLWSAASSGGRNSCFKHTKNTNYYQYRINKLLISLMWIWSL